MTNKDVYIWMDLLIGDWIFEDRLSRAATAVDDRRAEDREFASRPRHPDGVLKKWYKFLFRLALVNRGDRTLCLSGKNLNRAPAR